MYVCTEMWVSKKLRKVEDCKRKIREVNQNGDIATLTTLGSAYN